MGDLKSKLPNLQEIGSFAGKLFRDIKKSVCEIVDEYKQNHPEEKEAPAQKEPASNVEADSVSSGKTKTAKPKTQDAASGKNNKTE